MPGQRFSLAPALRVLAENVSILPAAGGAVEELQRPDTDEVEDADARGQDGDMSLVSHTAPVVAALTPYPKPPSCRAFLGAAAAHRFLELR